MTALRLTLLAFALAVGVYTDLAAQETVQLRPGTRVRLWWTNISIEPGGVSVQSGIHNVAGTIVSADANRLVFTPNDTTQAYYIPFAWLIRIDVSQKGERHSLRGAGIGGILGLLVGTVWAISNAASDPDVSVTDQVGEIVLYFALPGAAIGFAIGSFVRTDTWETVPLESIRFTGAANQGTGLSVFIPVGF